MKTILITGGAGFIGSHLCDRFIKDNYRVIAIDNLITGNIANIDHLFSSSNFIFHKGDVTNFTYVKGRLDYILHFASPASPIDYLKNPIHTLKVGSLGVHNLLGLAKEKKSTILVASTSEVYGDPLVHPQREDYLGNVNSIGPRGVYDEAKRFQEAMTMAYYHVHKVEVRVVRIFNTYGPRMRLDDGRALPNFMKQVLYREPITIYGNGNQTRSFCYIDDMIDGIVKLLFSNYCYPVNIGNPDEISLLEFAKEITTIANSNSDIVFRDLPEDDPKRRCPDISLAKKVLNWEPT